MGVDWTVIGAYFETRFRVSDADIAWPTEFVIISAYATTGETWAPGQNEAADKALAAALGERGVWLARVVGYSPSTGHAERSWAAEVTLDDGRDFGRRFLQDAVFHVKEADMWVVLCSGHGESVRMGLFRDRLDASG